VIKKFLFVSVWVSAVFANERPVRVYADIVGDLFHAGHVEFFKKARAFGDVLVIGILADDTVESYKRTPILTLEERAAVIGACRYVDEVIVDPPLRLTEEWIREHEIDFVVHGDDFNQATLRDQYGVALDLGIFRSVPYTKGVSTTEIIGRVLERFCHGK
jgi:cytidyltransferase-like protein